MWQPGTLVKFRSTDDIACARCVTGIAIITAFRRLGRSVYYSRLETQIKIEVLWPKRGWLGIPTTVDGWYNTEAFSVIKE